MDKTQNGPSYNSSAAMYPEKSARPQSRYAVHICRAAFFPPGLHPVLDGGEGDENPMVAPQVPTGGLVRQAVLDDEPHGQRDDAVRVAGLGQRVLGGVRREVAAAAGAVMLRVDEVEVTRSGRDQVPQVVKDAREDTVTRAPLAASRAGLVFEVAAAANDFGLGQILWARDTPGGVGQVGAGTRHGKPLLGQVFPARNLRHLPV